LFDYTLYFSAFTQPTKVSKKKKKGNKRKNKGNRRNNKMLLPQAAYYDDPMALQYPGYILPSFYGISGVEEGMLYYDPNQMGTGTGIYFY